MRKDLIEHIKDELLDFEVDYQEGAWENFKTSKKQQRYHWQWQAAAAVLIAVSMLYFLTKPNRPDVINNQNSLSRSAKHTTGTEISKHRNFNNRQAAAIIKSQTDKPENSTSLDNQELVNPGYIKSISLQHKQAIVATIRALYALNNDHAAGQQLPPGEYFSKNDDRFSLKNAVPNATKWSFNIGLGQAMDNRGKSNANAGIDVRYALTKNVALSTGVYYAHAGSEKRYDVAVNPGQPEKKITGSVTSIEGVDIPLRIDYKLNNKLHLIAGVSFLPIINQSRTLEFTESRSIAKTTVDPNGTVQTQMITVQEVSEMSIPKNELKKDNFAGFYNVSMSMKVYQLHGHAINIEPFVKIPLTRYSDQRFNLTQAGIQVKIGL